MVRVKPGLSKDEVTRLLDNPDGCHSRGEYESLRYSNRLISGWGWDGGDHFVDLNDAKVKEYGPGEMRQANHGSNLLVLVPAR